MPGSRYTLRPAVAMMCRPDGRSRFDIGDDAGDASAVVSEALNRARVDTTTTLGEASVVDGAHGRGAAGWVPVVEWVLSAATAGATWEVVKLAARSFRDLLERLRDLRVRVAVSRGAAALVAIDHVLEVTKEQGVLDVEAVEEPSACAGRAPSELNYTEIEPWLVSLLNEPRTTRYIVAVAPGGQVLDCMVLPMSEIEKLYGPSPDDGDLDSP
ncbi:MAG: hypothetical protein WD993_03165 [Thermoleophilaceae bacterium]